MGKGFNWVTFQVIGFEFEYDKHGPTFECSFGLLGFCGRLALYAPFETKQSAHLKDLLAEIKTHKCCTHKCTEDCTPTELGGTSP